MYYLQPSQSEILGEFQKRSTPPNLISWVIQMVFWDQHTIPQTVPMLLRDRHTISAKQSSMLLNRHTISRRTWDALIPRRIKLNQVLHHLGPKPLNLLPFFCDKCDSSYWLLEWSHESYCCSGMQIETHARGRDENKTIVTILKMSLSKLIGPKFWSNLHHKL